MKNKLLVRLAFLTLVVVAVVGIFIPLFKNLNYGLDLQGGFEVLYKVEPLEGSKVTGSMLTATYKTIQKRIDILGVSEPDISTEGNDRIRVKLAGITNEAEAREILSRTASLTFRDTSDKLLMTSTVLKAGSSKISQDSSGKPAVLLQVKDSNKFFSVTNKISKLNDNRLVIWLDFEEGVNSFANEESKCGSLNDSRCISSATVSQGFASDVIITGNFTTEEATQLKDLINSGSIPTKLTEISSKTVEASFGEASLNKTLIAGIIGIILIFVFMTLIYHFVGFIASIGILLYTFLVFSIFWLIGGVLTLPGIASLILGIGMSVDACVLSFERIKEELWEGKSLMAAFNTGYKMSFAAILDSNVTTLIVAVILFFLGESSVKGFATMLIISIIVTVIVMVFLIKWILKAFVKTNFFDKKTRLFVGVKPKDIPNIIKSEKTQHVNRFEKLNFLKPRKWILWGSLALNLVGIILALFIGLNLSVDYKGGTGITVVADKNISSTEIKQDIKDLKFTYNTVDSIDKKTVYIKIDDTLSKTEVNKLNKYFADKYNAKTEVGVVSNIVKKELTINAIYAVLISFIGIILYVSLRFKFNYAIAAILALVHDALLVFTIFSIFNIEISVIFVAAILTIIGYSINDTVVIFDRIRENIKNKFNDNVPDKDSLYKVINYSLGTTFVRSINTGIATILCIICLLIFGTFDIINFNIAMFIGLIIGCYSSLFIASPLLYEMEKRNFLKKNKVTVVKKPKKKKKEHKELDELEIKGINA